MCIHSNIHTSQDYRFVCISYVIYIYIYIYIHVYTRVYKHSYIWRLDVYMYTYARSTHKHPHLAQISSFLTHVHAYIHTHQTSGVECANYVIHTRIHTCIYTCTQSLLTHMYTCIHAYLPKVSDCLRQEVLAVWLRRFSASIYVNIYVS